MTTVVFGIRARASFTAWILPLAAVFVLAGSGCGKKTDEDAAARRTAPTSGLSDAVLPTNAPVAGESDLAAAYRQACDKIVECASNAEREQLGRDMLCVGVGMENGRGRVQGGPCEAAVTAHLRCVGQLTCGALGGTPPACSAENEASIAACQ